MYSIELDIKIQKKTLKYLTRTVHVHMWKILQMPYVPFMFKCILSVVVFLTLYFLSFPPAIKNNFFK